MNNTSEIKCYLCQRDARQTIFTNYVYGVECSRCGEYLTHYDTVSDLQHHREFPSIAYLFSGYFRFCKERNIRNQHFQYPNGKSEILNNPVVPRPNDIRKKLHRYLEYLQLKSEHLGFQVNINYQNDYPVCFAKNAAEMQAVTDHLIEAGYIQRKQGSPVAAFISLTVPGVEYLNQNISDSRQIFVAMAFTKEMIQTIQSIQEIVEKETGYRLVLVSDKEFNNNIEDRIIAEIHQSIAVVADFTHNNSGAYFEAGLALGAGKQVIFICRDAQDENGKSYIEKTHFDTSHRNHILWQDANDLAQKLIYRIKATISH